MIETMRDIIVAEDSKTQALQLEALLTAAGFAVRLAADGAEALEQARRRRPDVILSDIAMPVMNGFEMCRRIKDDPVLYEVPVVLLTALNSVDDIVNGLQCGADNFIRKPFDAAYLIGRLRHVIDARLSRGDQRVQMGVRIQLAGKDYFVDAERQQILDLLVSTYEEATRMTEQLRVQQQHLAGSYQWLESLCRIASAIAPALHPREVACLALEELLELPGVTGGAVLLIGADGAMQVAAIAGLGASRGLCADRERCACRMAASRGVFQSSPVRSGCALLGYAAPADAAPGMGVIVPLAVGLRTLGTLVLLTDGPDDGGAHGRPVLETAAQQVAVAIERSQLYSDMESLVRERTRALHSERHLTSQIVKTTAALVMLADCEGKIVLFNPACEAVFGWRAEEVIGKYFADVLLAPEQAAEVRDALSNLCSSAGQDFPCEHWRARDGSERRIIWTISPVPAAEEGEGAYWLATGLDVTEAEGLRERLRYLSHFDSCTGLPNRASLRARFELALKGDGQTVAGLLRIHCERLPLVRDSLGLAAEQALLTAMAARLKRWQRDGDYVARCDDGAFAVLAQRKLPEDMATPAAEILALMAPPFQVGAQELHIEVGVGIAVAPVDGVQFDVLVQAASAASRLASASASSRIAFHRPERLVAASERFRLEAALRLALERNELFLQYQPQVSLATGRIVGFESLLRWRHPEFGMVSPSRFIGIAEDTGLIHPIGEWALRQACLQLRDWQEQGLALVPIAVNLSAKQFASKIVGTVRAVLEEAGIDPAYLQIELTESVSMDDPESTFGILAALRDVGVQLAIDDFGTGYSNLSYLKQFPVQKLKLDQSFVRELVSSPHDLAISRAIIAMAHSLRLRVIAEGVETDGQLALLSENGCDEIQGYLFSKPVDAAAAADLLRRGASLDPQRLRRRRPAFGVLFAGAPSARCRDRAAGVLREVCGDVVELHAAGDPEQACELLATVDVTLLVAFGADEAPWAAFLELAPQLYPAMALLPVARDVAPDALREALRSEVAQAGLDTRALDCQEENWFDRRGAGGRRRACISGA